MDLSFLDWRDLVIVFNVVFFTNFIKYFIKFKKIYIYIPFFLSIIVFIILFLLKVYTLKDIVFCVFKWFCGSIMLYETILEKIRDILNNYNEENGGKDVREDL